MRSSRRTVLIVIAVLAACTIYTTGVVAQCGTAARQYSNALRAASGTRSIFTTQDIKAHDEIVPNDGTVAGLWDVTLTVNGQPFDEILDQYQADGNEVAMDIVPPVTGNVCLGVWQRTNAGRHHLSHYYWVFDPETNTVLIGRGRITMDFTLGRRGSSMSGTFTAQVRDLNGQPIPGFDDVAGEMTGVRLQ